MAVATHDHSNQGAVRASVFRRAMTDRGLDELSDVLGAASSLLSVEHAVPVDEIEDFGAANQALSCTWDAVVAALKGEPAVAEEVANSHTIVDLLTRIREMDTLVRIAETDRRHKALNMVRTALARFHDVESVSELIDLVPEAICGLGFDRSFISRIHDSMWLPEAVHVTGDPEWTEQILQAGVAHPQRLGPTLYESEILRRRVGILVSDVQHHVNKVHKEIAEVSLSRSYVAAPVMPGSRVIGFLHADRYFHKGEVDEFDRDMLALFAEGVSYALHRAVMSERLRTVRAEVAKLTEGITSTVDSYSSMDVEEIERRALDKPHPAHRPTSQADPSYFTYQLAPDSPLTRRELDVLKLMATGDTNARIANRLVVSEGTVKTHVKNILRKLGAANRAEAVARWLNLERKAHTDAH